LLPKVLQCCYQKRCTRNYRKCCILIYRLHLSTSLLSIAHSGTCLSRHKLRLQKTAPALPHAAAFRCPHFVAGFLLPAPSLHSLTARASPSGFAKKSTPLRSAAFSLAFGRLKAALPALFPLRPLTAPDHPPLKKSQSNFIPTQKPIPIQFEINIFSKNKKENAKIAPFQALRQGQALRVCYTKISTPRFASGRIIVQVSAEANLFDYAERSR